MNSSTFKKEPANGYGQNPDVYPQDGLMAVGFSYAVLYRDENRVWIHEDAYEDIQGWMSCEQAEKLAASDPDHDWRVVFHGPLSDRIYQRHSPGQWVLIKKTPVFCISS